MTLPRRHIPGQVTMLTRRTAERRFFLRPDAPLNHAVEWEIAKATTRYSVPIHALIIMMNHAHIVATDLLARRSDFMRDFCSGTTQARNAMLDRDGAMWDCRPYGDTVMLDKDAAERKILYTLLNPVKAGLVRRAELWPGFKILPRDWGKPRTVHKPSEGHYSDEKVEPITYTPMPPEAWADEPLDEVIAYFERRLREEEDRIAQSRRARGRGFAHPRSLLRVEPYDRPKTRSRRGISPRFASTDGKLMARAQRLWHSFLNAYAACRRFWRADIRDIIFPAGTLKYRVEHRARCRSPDPDDPTLIL